MRLTSVSVIEMQCDVVLTLRWIWQHDLTAEDDTAAEGNSKLVSESCWAGQPHTHCASVCSDPTSVSSKINCHNPRAATSLDSFLATRTEQYEAVVSQFTQELGAQAPFVARWQKVPSPESQIQNWGANGPDMLC